MNTEDNKTDVLWPVSILVGLSVLLLLVCSIGGVVLYLQSERLLREAAEMPAKFRSDNDKLAQGSRIAGAVCIFLSLPCVIAIVAAVRKRFKISAIVLTSSLVIFMLVVILFKPS